jgi:putative membrane protein insertion efficiency factor
LNHRAKFVTLQLLRAYKWAISPMLPAVCRYVPTCSEYAMEAVERYGALRGGWMAFARILRCHPFAGSGYDPVVKDAKLCGSIKNLATTVESRP